MKQTSLLKYVSQTRNLPAPPSDMHVPPDTPPPAGGLSPHRASIEAAFGMANWNWAQWTCPGWRECFYDVLYERSLTAPPLQPSEAHQYLSSISPLPRIGFFPHPNVAVRNLARIRTFLSVHEPMPMSARLSSTLCVPAEHCAKACVPMSPHVFLGFHMGWITPVNYSPPPEAATYVVSLTILNSHRTLQAWDHTTSALTRARIFPLSHVNEFIWADDLSPSNPNNLGSSHTAMVTTRSHVPKGAELTLGYGLYEYDWSAYKLILFRRALEYAAELGDIQGRPDVRATTTQIGASTSSLRFSQLPTGGEEARLLAALVDGTFPTTFPSPLTIGNRSASEYVKSLGGSPDFAQRVTFRVADHPSRRSPPDWRSLLIAEAVANDSSHGARRSPRLCQSHRPPVLPSCIPSSHLCDSRPAPRRSARRRFPSGRYPLCGRERLWTPAGFPGLPCDPSG